MGHHWYDQGDSEVTGQVTMNARPSRSHALLLGGGGGFLPELTGLPYADDTTREEWTSHFERAGSRMNGTSFGADDVSLATLGQAALAAVLARGWQDAQTQAAVLSWQGAHNASGASPTLKVDGKYGPMSATALGNDLQMSVPTAYWTGNPSIATTAAPAIVAANLNAPSLAVTPQTSPALALAQKVIDLLKSKGPMDSEARKAVKEWQRARGGLTVDGIYGPASSAALAADLQIQVPPGLTSSQTAAVAAASPSPSDSKSSKATGLDKLSVEAPAAGKKIGEAIKSNPGKTIAWVTLGVGAAAVGVALFKTQKTRRKARK